VTIARKFRVHPIARLARFAMTDRVWQNDKKLCCIEWLIFSEKFTRKLQPNELGVTASCSVHDQNCIGRLALRIFLRFAKRPIMETQVRQRLTRSKFEIADCVIALDWRRIISRRSVARGDNQQK